MPSMYNMVSMFNVMSIFNVVSMYDIEYSTWGVNVQCDAFSVVFGGDGDGDSTFSYSYSTGVSACMQGLHM